jgi:hypothetical protein
LIDWSHFVIMGNTMPPALAFEDVADALQMPARPVGSVVDCIGGYVAISGSWTGNGGGGFDNLVHPITSILLGSLNSR